MGDFKKIIINRAMAFKKNLGSSKSYYSISNKLYWKLTI